MDLKLLAYLFAAGVSAEALASRSTPVPGLVPEIRQNNPSDLDENTLKAETMIARSENQAIKSLIGVIQRKKGTAEEPELLLRLAELYTRRAKTGRAFDVYRMQENQPLSWAPPQVQSEGAKKHLEGALKVYDSLVRRFPDFHELDMALFFGGFIAQQVEQNEKAIDLFGQLERRFPKSRFLPEAVMTLGELHYQKKDFKTAIHYFERAEKTGAAKVAHHAAYKKAWAHYNLKNNVEAIDNLKKLVTQRTPLAKEALRDLTLFYGENYPANQVVSFFSGLAKPEELPELLYSMGNLYLSWSRHEDLITFSRAYIQIAPNNTARLKFEGLILESLEHLKKRDLALKQYEEFARLCSATSTWRKANPEIAKDECANAFDRRALVFQKWLELYERNKTHPEAIRLIERAFEIEIKEENPAEVNPKLHFAYAELLFNRNDYARAQKHYLQAARASVQSELKESSLYGAIVSGSKIEKPYRRSFLALLDEYLTQFGDHPHAEQVLFLKGVSLFTLGDLEAALPIARKLATGNIKDISIKNRSREIVLEIYNRTNQMADLKTFATEVQAEVQDEKEKSRLAGIAQTANFNLVLQSIEKNTEAKKSIDSLTQYFRENRANLELSRNALRLALAKSLESQLYGTRLELTELWLAEFGKDKETPDILKQNLKFALDLALLDQALVLLEEIIPLTQGHEQNALLRAQAELQILSGRASLGRKTLLQLADRSPASEKTKILTEVLQGFSAQDVNSREHKEFMEKVQRERIEPLFSASILEGLREDLNRNKDQQVFKAARRLFGSAPTPEIRAGAKLLQAKVLEKEFVQTSTKTSFSKLPRILEIKTERFEKALSAYLEVRKIRHQDIQVERETFEGLIRIYSNFIDTVGSPPIRGEVPAEEWAQLKQELQKIVSPIVTKREELQRELTKWLNTTKSQVALTTSLENTPISDSISPPVGPLKYSHFRTFVPNSLGGKSFVPLSSLQASGVSCPAQNPGSVSQILEAFYRCLESNEFNRAQQLRLSLLNESQVHSWLPWLGAVQSLSEQKFALAEQQIQKSLEKNPTDPLLVYTHALTLANQSHLPGKTTRADLLFSRALELGFDQYETRLVASYQEFLKRNWLGSLQNSEKIPIQLLEEHRMLSMISEALAQSGNLNRAISEQQKIVRSNPSVFAHLQMARLQESFKRDQKAALASYESALALHSADGLKENPELLNWIREKVAWLKTQTLAVRVSEPAQGGSL